MHIAVVSLFPEFFSAAPRGAEGGVPAHGGSPAGSGPLHCGLMQRAREAGILSFSLHNPRDAAKDKHHTVDDRPYGGSPGMVMLAEPLADTLQGLGFTPRRSRTERSPALAGADAQGGSVVPAAPDKSATGTQEADPGRLLFLSPKGRPLTQALARELALSPRLTLICGRYEGMDARIEELFPVETVSVGDFVLNGGEAAALCLIEAVARLLPGFMGHEESGDDESFSHGLLEYPHYTRPEEFHGISVPQVLRSGDHGRIAAWRRRASLAVTLANRPELLQDAALTGEDQDFLRGLPYERRGRNLYCALVHYPVLDKQKNSVAVSLTNLDIHDIARSSCTYGLAGYYVVTPLQDQLRLLSDILKHWTQGAGKAGNPDRDEALGLVRGQERVEDVLQDIATRTGQKPLVIGTTARAASDSLPAFGFSRIREALRSRPVLLLFGTGHGLSPLLDSLCHGYAPALRRYSGYNHLSVRSAAAIILDRILGDWS